MQLKSQNEGGVEQLNSRKQRSHRKENHQTQSNSQLEKDVAVEEEHHHNRTSSSKSFSIVNEQESESKLINSKHENKRESVRN